MLRALLMSWEIVDRGGTVVVSVLWVGGLVVTKEDWTAVMTRKSFFFGR